MHPVLETILKTKDLAKAGDLFSISDEKIEKGCSGAIELVDKIISQPEYVNMDSDQSVVEICITRITSAIRETDTIESHILTLVALLRSCLSFKLDTNSSPHAKIVSDVLSCVFQNYSRKMVMEMAAPVAVLFLDKGNAELTRNITSYLSLAVINYSHLVAPHVDCVIRSLAKGNKSLLKLLPSLYASKSEPMYANIEGLVGVIATDTTTEEKTMLLELYLKIATAKPKIMEPYLPALTEHLATAELSPLILSIMDQIAKDNTQCCIDYKEQLMEVAKDNPATAPQVARIMGRIGRLNEREAEECIDYLGNQLGSADTKYLPTLLQQLLHIGQKFPDLLRTHMDSVATFGESKEVEVKRLVSRLLELLNTNVEHPGPDKGGSLISVGKRSTSSDKVIEPGVRSRASPRPPSVTSSISEQPPTAEPQYRDAVHKFCEKHQSTIKAYIEKLMLSVPLPTKCTVEEKKKRKYRYVRLYFGCSKKDKSCLYPNQSFFTLKSKLPRLWIHLMFLNLQARSSTVLKQQDTSVTALASCWQCLMTDRSDSFVRLATSSFPTTKEQDTLIQELWDARFFDVISLEPVTKTWCCFMCNNPDKLSGYIKPDGTPGITGELKEKNGKWKLFKRWKKRYFTLSGDHITYQKTGNKLETLNVSHIESVRACRKKPRDVPKAFEIFTEDGDSYKFKSSNSKNVERWVQCLNLALSKQRTTTKYFTVS